MFPRSKFLRLSLIFLGVLGAAFAFVFGSWSFTLGRLNSARSIGVFPSPAEGMLTLVESGYIGIQEARIVHSVPETVFGGKSHVWYVIACVWAESREDGSSVGSPTHDFDAPGSYYVNTHEGWILMPEASQPLFVGFWMKIFGLAGDDHPQPFHDPSIESKPMCVRQTG